MLVKQYKINHTDDGVMAYRRALGSAIMGPNDVSLENWMTNWWGKAGSNFQVQHEYWEANYSRTRTRQDCGKEILDTGGH